MSGEHPKWLRDKIASAIALSDDFSEWDELLKGSPDIEDRTAYHRNADAVLDALGGELMYRDRASRSVFKSQKDSHGTQRDPVLVIPIDGPS